MNDHEELRKKLDSLNGMLRGEASEVVTEVLKYLMDSIKKLHYIEKNDS